MDIGWFEAIIDVDAEQFDASATFWGQVTESTFGKIHPDHDEFMHLLPTSGDTYLEMQRIGSGPPAAHLDLLVPDIGAAIEEAVAAGAELIERPGHGVLQTPGGVRFCIVPFSTQSERAPLLGRGTHAVDQICLDVGHEDFESDVLFWSTITGWEPNPPILDEFRSFSQTPGMPLRLLIQRLGHDDAGPPRAHLDIAAGSHVDDVVRSHIEAGAVVTEAKERWTALEDPSGMPYCVTARQPHSF